MPTCNRTVVPLCSLPRLVSRDGQAGPNAKIRIPFVGYHFFSGETFTPGGGQIPQDKSRIISGITKPDNFSKTCC